MKKKIVSLLLVAAMTMTMFVGCGGNSDKKNQENSSSTQTTEGGGTFIVPINSDSVTWINPFSAYGSDDQLIAFSPSFDPLFIVNKDETRRRSYMA